MSDNYHHDVRHVRVEEILVTKLITYWSAILETPDYELCLHIEDVLNVLSRFVMF
jgi:hypothetical protein